MARVPRTPAPGSISRIIHGEQWLGKRACLAGVALEGPRMAGGAGGGCIRAGRWCSAGQWCPRSVPGLGDSSSCSKRVILRRGGGEREEIDLGGRESSVRSDRGEDWDRESREAAIRRTRQASRASSIIPSGTWIGGPQNEYSSGSYGSKPGSRLRLQPRSTATHWNALLSWRPKLQDSVPRVLVHSGSPFGSARLLAMVLREHESGRQPTLLQGLPVHALRARMLDMFDR